LNTSELPFEVHNSFECLNIISNQQSHGNYYFLFIFLNLYRYTAQNVTTGEW